jgi:tetratricopeptide (TPR) repeat protein
VKNLTSFKSDLVSSVSVDKKGPDGKYVVTFHLVNDDVESFDYLTDQPSRLIMDFYVSSNNRAKAQAKNTKKMTPGDLPTKLPEKVVASAGKPGKTVAAKNLKATQRKPATADALVISNQGVNVAQNDSVNRFGIFDGGDPNYDRFSVKDYEIKEESIIRSKDNYYIPFPMLQSPSEAWDKIKAAPSVYEIAPKDSDENKQARLLLTLFEKQRYAVYLKTVQWFKQKYPESGYNEIIDYMTADTHLKMWQDKGRPGDYDQALLEYKDAVHKYPKSPLAERTSLKIGYLALEKGDALDALRLFKEHIDNKNFDKKESFSKDLARIGMGIAFSRLNRYDEAIDQYNQVEKNSPFKDLKTEAAFRRGDVRVQAHQYTQAVEDYKNSLKKYPEAQGQYPNAYYNQAESLFGMDKFHESLDVYREFVKKFPSNEHAPFAMTRLGELMEILGADKSRVIGAYLETYFRYGENPSAIIARLRLLSARMKGMKPKEVEGAVDEIMSLAKKLDLPNIEQFATVLVADGFTRREEFPKAVDLLTKYYQQNPTTVDRNLITRRIVSNISDKIRAEVDKGDFIQALKTHQKFQDSWLKHSDRLDIKYDLGRSFEMAGVPKEAEKYYRDVLNKMYALKGTKEGKEVAVVEKLPTEDEVNLRLASLMSQEQKFSQSYEYLKNIKNPASLPEDKQIERVELAVKLLEKRGDIDSAVRYLTELLSTWKGQPELVAEPYAKLSELALKQNKTDEAIQALNKVDELMRDSGKVSPDLHQKSLETLADLYLQKNQQDKAIETYQKLLDTYEDKKPLASLRYKLGDIYFKRGEVQKAAEVWNDIKGNKSDFWKNLAQEQLKNSEWRDNYKKYIKRIPAMSESESK